LHLSMPLLKVSLFSQILGTVPLRVKIRRLWTSKS
jgi:hypothetical protein